MLTNNDIIKRRDKDGKKIFFSKDRTYRSEQFDTDELREIDINKYLEKQNKIEEKRLQKALNEKELIKAVNE